MPQVLRCGKFTLDLSRPLVMGVVNVTPDSFSDGGHFLDSKQAIAHARRLAGEGADILDIGGESTRPGAAPVSLEEERRRVLPVLEALAAGNVPVSVDTRKPALMREAVAAGASMVNDVTALSSPGALDAVAKSPVAVCLMHMQGEPGTMQSNPAYRDVALEVRDYLASRVAAAEAAGIGRDRIVVDPGFGFGKTLDGKDTRVSGYMFESALEAGLSAAGVDCQLLGPMPTPGIAYLTRTLHAAAGIVISASHNPHEDNGIKFFSGRGEKLSDEVELAIEAEFDKPLETVASAELGRATRLGDAAGRYIEFCKRAIDLNLDLDGLKVVLDCANGATYQVAPAVFSELGADVVRIGAQPDGLNINVECGSTHPEALQRAVSERGAAMASPSTATATA